MSARSFGGAVARTKSDDSPALWGAPVAAVAVAVFVAVYGLWFWWETYASSSGCGDRWSDEAAAAGRGFLMSESLHHVDPATGLVVVSPPHGWGDFGGPMPVEPPPVAYPRAEYIAAWNAAVERRLSRGEPVGPRFLDRVTTLDAVRERFRRDAAEATVLPADGFVLLGGKEVRHWFGKVIVRERGATRWLQPVGGAPFFPYPPGPEPESWPGEVVRTALVADEGRSLWVRVATTAGLDVDYWVVDLVTGTYLYEFLIHPR